MEQHGVGQRPADPAGGEMELGGFNPVEAVRAAAEIARENPHAALAGALAVGFVLGGGLTPRLLVSLALFAGRRYAAEAAREVLGEAVRRQMDEVAAP